MGVFLGILFGVLTAASIAAAIVFCRSGVKRGKTGKKVFGGVSAVFAVVFFFLFVFVPFGFTQVSTGEAAVVKVWGEATEARGAGLHFRNVISERYEIFDLKTQKMDISTSIYTKDAQPADIVFSVQYRLNEGSVVEISRQYGDMDSLSVKLRDDATEKAKSTLAQRDAMTLVETRSELSPAVQAAVAEIAPRYYVTIDTLSIVDISFSDAFEDAVEQKMIAEQEKFKAEQEKEKAVIKAEEEAETARIKAEADLVVAKTNAEKALVAAQGDADAQAAIAEGAARALKIKYVETARMLGLPIKATELKEDVLDEEGNVAGEVVTGILYEIDEGDATPEQYELLAEYMRYINYLETWDGKLPSVIGDGSGLGGLIINPAAP